MVSFVLQSKEIRKGPWKAELSFENLGIEPCYFGQCMEKAFLGDKGVVIVKEKTIIFEREDKIQNQGAFCKARARELMDLLKKHPLWGKSGGPDLSDDYHKLD